MYGKRDMGLRWGTDLMMWHLLHLHICSSVQNRDICSFRYITALRIRWKKLGVHWGMEQPGRQVDIGWIILVRLDQIFSPISKVSTCFFVKNEPTSSRNSFKRWKCDHQNGRAADFQQCVPSDNDRSVLITCTVTQHALYLAAWCELDVSRPGWR